MGQPGRCSGKAWPVDQHSVQTARQWPVDAGNPLVQENNRQAITVVDQPAGGDACLARPLQRVISGATASASGLA